MIEVILALSIMAMLIGSVFTITNSSMLLSQNVLDQQQEQRHRRAFEVYLETIFRKLPHDAKLELSEDENGRQRLTIHRPGTFFPSYQNDRYAERFEASIARDRDGFLKLVTHWSGISNSNSPDSASLSSGQRSDTDSKHTQSLSLMNGLTSIQWEIYSAKDRAWYPTWSTSLERPSHVKIIFGSAVDEPKTRIFWIPPQAAVR